MLYCWHGQVTLYGCVTCKLIIHINDLYSPCWSMMALPVMLFPHFVENYQHHSSHESDSHKTTNYDFGSLHNLIYSWDPVVCVRHRNGERFFCWSCALWSEWGCHVNGFPVGNWCGPNLLCGLCLILRRFHSLYRDGWKVRVTRVIQGSHIQRGRSRGIPNRVTHHACVQTRVLHSYLGKI